VKVRMGRRRFLWAIYWFVITNVDNMGLSGKTLFIVVYWFIGRNASDVYDFGTQWYLWLMSSLFIIIVYQFKRGGGNAGSLNNSI